MPEAGQHTSFNPALCGGDNGETPDVILRAYLSVTLPRHIIPRSTIGALRAIRASLNSANAQARRARTGHEPLRQRQPHVLSQLRLRAPRRVGTTSI